MSDSIVLCILALVVAWSWWHCAPRRVQRRITRWAVRHTMIASAGAFAAVTSVILIAAVAGS
jgi:hypothetical protein